MSSAKVISLLIEVPIGRQVIRLSSFLFGSLSRIFTFPGFTTFFSLIT